MNTLDYVLEKFNIDLSLNIRTDGYVVIPNKKRIDLVKLFNELNFKSGAEIGVMRGKFSDMICRNNPQIKLYAIDSWEKYNGYDDFIREDQFLSFYNDAVNFLSKYNCEIIKKTSMEAVKDFEDESLDFVYIDANHAFNYILEDIIEWTKKVKKGGIVAGHDFNEFKKTKLVNHVKFALDACIKLTKLDRVFILGKRISKNRDFDLSWFFVKV